MERDNDGYIIFNSKFSQLYKKVNYLAPPICVINTIYEYDIRRANISVLYNQDDISEKLYNRLSDVDGMSRKVYIGNLIRKDKSYAKKISKGIISAKLQLFKNNNIIDEDVLSIKNDAVFVIGRKLKLTKFGAVEFVVKNSYSLYHNINGLEIFYNKNDDLITIKGLNDLIYNNTDQQNGIIIFLKTVFNYLIYDRRDKLREYLISFVDDYKSRKLPYQYYREMNHENMYRMISNIDGYYMNLESVNDEMVGDINITYNYMFYVLPIIQQYLF